MGGSVLDLILLVKCHKETKLSLGLQNVMGVNLKKRMWRRRSKDYADFDSL